MRWVRPIGARNRWTLGALLSLAASGIFGLSCSKEPRIEERALYVYSPRACPITQDLAYSVIYANGDFVSDPERPPVASLYLREVGTVLTDLPRDTRSIFVDVSQPAQEIDWRGVTDVPSRGPVNVLVWPGGEACNLTRNIEEREHATFGTFGRSLMIAGGVLRGGGQVPHTFVGDLSTGILEALPFGLGTRRAFATITEFRERDDETPVSALVAGGQDPDSDTPLATGEVYVPKPGQPGDLGDFERERVELSEPRTQHGAAVLVSGETILVGGIGQSGAKLRSMEIIDPKTRKARTSGVALLSVARSNPSVIRLASGELLVAGGVGQDGNPVPTLEWFSADASRPTKRPSDLVTGRARAIVPLDAGGALAVIAPVTPSADFKTVWIISADGALEPAVSIDPDDLEQVRLFQGPEGSPILFTGKRWLRWQPWFGAFQAVADAPTSGPRSDAYANGGDKGLALWLEERSGAGTFVTGFRFATRSQFGVVPRALLVDSPFGLAPDRLPGLPGSSIHWSIEGGLQLGAGASAFVVDATFASCAVDVDVTADAPIVVLRQQNGRELEVGGATCAFGQGARTSLSIARTGKEVRVRIDGGDERPCPTELDEGARVSIGLRGPASGAGTSGSRNLRVTRR